MEDVMRPQSPELRQVQLIIEQDGLKQGSPALHPRRWLVESCEQVVKKKAVFRVQVMRMVWNRWLE